MDLTKVPTTTIVSVERKLGHKVLECKQFYLNPFFDALSKKICSNKKEIEDLNKNRQAVIDGNTFKFKFKNFNWVVKPMHSTNK